MVATDVNTNEFITLLLKCVGSKYPVTLVLKDNREINVYVLGFSGASCTTLNAMAANNEFIHVAMADVKAFISPRAIALKNLKGFTFKLIEN